MQDLLEYLLFHPALVERPDRIFMLAGGFAAAAVLTLLGRTLRTPVRPRTWPLFAVAALWALSALWEASLKGKGYNIRVDLLFLHPALTLLSVLAVAGAAWPVHCHTGPADSEAVAGASEA